MSFSPLSSEAITIIKPQVIFWDPGLYLLRMMTYSRSSRTREWEFWNSPLLSRAFQLERPQRSRFPLLNW